MNSRTVFWVIPLLTGSVWAGNTPDKSDDTLFSPTPRQRMRELSPDRPDTTESPITVDAGRVQLEMSFLDYTRTRRGGQREQAWTAGDMNLKMGLTHNMDVQLLFGAYGEQVARGPGADQIDSGFGDLTVRWKTNLWGNDGGTTALALMPHVTIPTGTALSVDRPQGGLVVPLGISLTEHVSAAVMAQVDAVYEPSRRGYELQLLHSATLGVDVLGPLGAYVEYVGVAGTGHEQGYEAYFDTGLTWALSEDLLLDAGMRIGLNDAAQDLGLFAGMTVRY